MLSRRQVLAAGLMLPVAAAKDWPSYRGEGAAGVGDGTAPSVWNGDATAGPLRNIVWRADVPGLGHSSPTVAGDRLFLLTAVASGGGRAPLKLGAYGSGNSADDNGEQEWLLLCFNRRNGKLLWRQSARRAIPRTKRHTKATHANTTAATDGRRVVALFGSEGLYCYTVDGKIRLAERPRRTGHGTG
jgi:outer membrane protein assembly factor BamB